MSLRILQIADKPTLDSVKQDSTEIKTLIGNTEDIGATATFGTVMGKLNNLVESIKKGQTVYTPNGSKTFALATPSTAPDFTITADDTKKDKFILIGVPFKCKCSGIVAVDIDVNVTYNTNNYYFQIWAGSVEKNSSDTKISPVSVSLYENIDTLPNGTVLTGNASLATVIEQKSTGFTQGEKTNVNLHKYLDVRKGDIIRIMFYSNYAPVTIEDINIKLKYDEYEGD